MSNNYYYLVASLPEYTPDSDTKGLNVKDLITEIQENISSQDKKTVTFFLNFFDIQNILQMISGREGFNILGNYTQKDIKNICEQYFPKQSDEKKEEEELTCLPEYISQILKAYQNPAEAMEMGINTELPLDRTLWNRYFSLASASSNRFIREWYSFECDIRNIAAAFTCRNKGWEIASSLIGTNEITDMLISSSAPDFGLKGIFDSIDSLLQILETQDMLGKEKKLDTFRWEKINDITSLDYFNIDCILGFIAKYAIIHRWLVLEKHTGEKMFKKLIDELTDRKLLQ